MHTDDPSERKLSLEEKHQKQYEMLREELVSLGRETRRVEVYAVSAVAALYAWFLKENSGVHYYWLLIGAVMVVLSALRSLALYGRINEITEYLIEIEKYLFGQTAVPRQLPGWERHRASSHNPNAKPQNRWIAWGFWSVFLVVTIYGPILLARFGEQGASPNRSIAHTLPSGSMTITNPVIESRESVSTPVRDTLNASMGKPAEETAAKRDEASANRLPPVQTKGGFVPFPKSNPDK
jgi:hypothetical protein